MPDPELTGEEMARRDRVDRDEGSLVERVPTWRADREALHKARGYIAITAATDEAHAVVARLGYLAERIDRLIHAIEDAQRG